jgi:hypothetical protein
MTYITREIEIDLPVPLPDDAPIEVPDWPQPVEVPQEEPARRAE